MSHEALSTEQFGPLYHGTDAHPLEDDFVYPTEQGEGSYEGMKVAFATQDLEEAKRFGKHVYEVEPAPDTEEGWANTVFSEKGFKVKRKVHP